MTPVFHLQVRQLFIASVCSQQSNSNDNVTLNYREKTQNERKINIPAEVLFHNILLLLLPHWLQLY